MPRSLRQAPLTLMLAPLLLAGCFWQKRSTALDNYLQGQLAADQGHLNDALANLSKAIEKDPNMSLAIMARGQVERKMGDYQKAADDFQKATVLEPFNFDAHYQLGVMMQYMQKFTDAIRSYQKAVEIRPLDPDANMNLAIVYTQMGQPLRGLPYARRAVEGGAASPLTHANLGILYAQVGNSDEAIAQLKAALELNSHEPQVYVNLAAQYIQQSKYEAARNVLTTGRAIVPTPAIHERLGLCYYKLNQSDAAESSYRDALKLDGNYFQAYNGLGVVYMARAISAQPPDVTSARQAVENWNHSLAIEANQPNIRALVQRYAGQYGTAVPEVQAIQPAMAPATQSK